MSAPSEGAPPAPEQRLLARHQPCGCVVCYCDDPNACFGCGAKSCGTHPVGEIPNPVYASPSPRAQETDTVSERKEADFRSSAGGGEGPASSAVRELDGIRAEAAETGYLVVRRKRVGTMLANSAGLGDCAEVYYGRLDAEDCRDAMTCPRDWDVVEVHVARAAKEIP